MPERPFSTDSIVSPRAALAALGGGGRDANGESHGVSGFDDNLASSGIEAGPSRPRQHQHLQNRGESGSEWSHAAERARLLGSPSRDDAGFGTSPNQRNATQPSHPSNNPGNQPREPRPDRDDKRNVDYHYNNNRNQQQYYSDNHNLKHRQQSQSQTQSHFSPSVESSRQQQNSNISQPGVGGSSRVRRDTETSVYNEPGRSPNKQHAHAYTSPGQSPHSHTYSDEYEEPPYLVRAKFDFTSTDPSALVFTAGDVIEVITMLESGWWDGMIGQSRGWFPSNYIEEIPVGEEMEDEGEREGRWADAPVRSTSRTGQRPSEGDGGRQGQYAQEPQPQAHPLPDGPRHIDASVPFRDRRSVFAEDILNMDDALGVPDWGVDEYAESMGISLGSLGLNDRTAGSTARARKGGDNGGDGDSDGSGNDFAAAARVAQNRAAIANASNSESLVSAAGRLPVAQPGRSPVGVQGSPSAPTSARDVKDARDMGIGMGMEEELGGEDDFGAGLQNTLARRQAARDAMEDNLRSGQPGSASRPDTTPPSGSAGGEWVPCLTPDGEVSCIRWLESSS